jgi:hypothetical protein
MSGCFCSDTTELRVTGEVSQHAHPDAVGTGEKSVRVRCASCGGKVGRIGSDLLTELFGIPADEIVNGRCLSKSEQRTLTVDLI